MSWDQDPFLDPLSNNDLEEADFNDNIDRGILGQEYLNNNPSSNWWFRDPYSERLAAEKSELKKKTAAKVAQKDSSSPFYDLSDRFETSERMESSIISKKNSSFPGVDLSPSYSPNSIGDLRGNILETFKGLEYTDKLTRSPEYDPSIPEPPKKITRPNSVHEFPKSNIDIPGSSKKSHVTESHSSESKNESVKPELSSFDKSPSALSQNLPSRKLSSSNGNNVSVKEIFENINSSDIKPKEFCSKDINDNIKLSVGPASTQEISQNAHECDHWGTSTFSWDSPPRGPTKPTASWDSPPRVSSKPAASWDSPPRVPSKPTAPWDSPPRVSSKPTVSWDSPPRVPFKPSASWGSPPRVPSKPTASWNSSPHVPSRSKVDSLPISHKKPFSQNSLRPQTISNTSGSKPKTVFSSKPSYLNKTPTNVYKDKKPETNDSGPRTSVNSEQKFSFEQVWEDGFLEAAALILDNIPDTYSSSCNNQIRKKYPHLIYKGQIKKPRFDSYRPSFVSVSENLAKTSQPSTHQPSLVDPNDLNVNQLNYMRRLQAMESNFSLPQSSNAKSCSVNSLSPGPPIRNNGMNTRPKMPLNQRTFKTANINCHNSSSSQRGRSRNNFRPSSRDYNHTTPRVEDSTSFDLLDINTSLVELVMSNERFLGYESLPVKVRDRVVRLAKEYGLKVHCSGSGASLALNLEKVGGTHIPANTLAIQALLATPLDDPVDIFLLKKMMSAGETQWQGWPTY